MAFVSVKPETIVQTMISGTSKENVIEIFNRSIQAVNPYEAVTLHADIIRSEYVRGNFRRLILIAFGKAASQMALSVDDKAGDLLTGGIIVTKYGHLAQEYRNSKIAVYEAGHPLPDANGLRAAKEIMRMINGADKETLFICLISAPSGEKDHITGAA